MNNSWAIRVTYKFIGEAIIIIIMVISVFLSYLSFNLICND